jgi:hypothetical protein
MISVEIRKRSRALQQWLVMRNGVGCPYCAAGVGQRALYERVKKLLPTEEVLMDKGAPFLKGQRFDIWVPGRKAAIEYHGRQHYEPIAAYGGEEELEKIKARDDSKRQKCRKEGVRLLEVPFFRERKMTDKELMDFLSKR